MKSKFITNIINLASRKTLKLQKNSHVIMVVGGTIGLIGAGVAACFATRKLDEELEDIAINVEVARDMANNEELPENVRTEEVIKRDVAMAYAKGAFNIVKLYAPSVILAGVSVASIFGGHKILNDRHVALAAGYSALDAAFKNYKKRVADELGEDVERRFAYGLTKEKTTEETVDEKTGKTKKVKKDVDVAEEGIEGYSPYARIFDDASREWTKDRAYNVMFLNGIQEWANRRLASRGKLFLNEVYEALDIPITKAGQIVGWLYDNDRGDNHVDFGIYNIKRRENRDFVNGYIDAIVLDFNVDGPIIDMI